MCNEDEGIEDEATSLGSLKPAPAAKSSPYGLLCIGIFIEVRRGLRCIRAQERRLSGLGGHFGRQRGCLWTIEVARILRTWESAFMKHELMGPPGFLSGFPPFLRRPSTASARASIWRVITLASRALAYPTPVPQILLTQLDSMASPATRRYIASCLSSRFKCFLLQPRPLLRSLAR